MTGTSGYFDLTSGFFTVRTYWSETYDISTNASIVQIDSLQIKTSYLGNEYPNGSITIDGTSVVTFNAYAGTHNFYVGTTGVFVAVNAGAGNPAAPWKSGAIYHNADGTKSVTIAVNISGSKMGGGWSVSGSKTIELTTIPRASTPTLSTASPYAGDTVTIYTNRKVSSYTHDITYYFGNTSGTIGTNVGDSTQWNIPIALAKAITGTSGTLTIRTVTKSGSTQLGTSDIAVTLGIPDNDTTKPKITSVTLSPVHSLPSKFSGVYVQGRSAIKAQISASSDYSTIAGYGLNALGGNYSGNPAQTNVLSISGEVAVKATVTDARGYSRSATQNVLYYPYSNPSVAPPDGQSQITCKRCKADGTIDRSGLYLKIEAGRKFSPVNGLNQCELRYRYAVAGGAFTDWTSLLEKGSADNYVSVVLEGVVDSAVTAYAVEIGVADDIGSEKSVTFPIGTASAVWHAAEGGEALGIGGYAQRKGVDVFWGMYMNNNKVSGLPTPTEDSDAVPKNYMDGQINTRALENHDHSGETLRPNALEIPDGTLEITGGLHISGGMNQGGRQYMNGTLLACITDNNGVYQDIYGYYLNPPFSLGTEYLVTERWNYSAVYKKWFNVGNLATAGGTVSVAHGMTNPGWIIGCRGVASMWGSNAMEMVNGGGNGSVFVEGDYIKWYSGIDLSSYVGFVEVTYCKS